MLSECFPHYGGVFVDPIVRQVVTAFCGQDAEAPLPARSLRGVVVSGWPVGFCVRGGHYRLLFRVRLICFMLLGEPGGRLHWLLLPVLSCFFFVRIVLVIPCYVSVARGAWGSPSLVDTAGALLVFFVGIVLVLSCSVLSWYVFCCLGRPGVTFSGCYCRCAPSLYVCSCRALLCRLVW